MRLDIKEIKEALDDGVKTYGEFLRWKITKNIIKRIKDDSNNKPVNNHISFNSAG